jgi:hypothetical protein
MITKEDLVNSALYFYEINFFSYLVNKFEPILILYTAILMLYHNINGSHHIWYLFLLIFLVYSIKLYLLLTVSKVNSSIYTEFLIYLDNNPIVVITNTNPNYNEIQRVIDSIMQELEFRKI